MTGPTPTPSWYDLLGVAPDASAEEVRAVWRAQIADLDPTDRRFAVLNQAAEVLLDPERRAAYDAELAPRPEARPAAEPEPGSDAEPEPGSEAGPLAGVLLARAPHSGARVRPVRSPRRSAISACRGCP